MLWMWWVEQILLFQALDSHIEKIENLDIDPDADEEEHEEEEGSIHCVTCGHEVSVKTCIKHMERCYNKVCWDILRNCICALWIMRDNINWILILQYESQTSFGSTVKTGIEGTPIFCDFYHAVHRTYCKRLKVLCPEHSKDPKVRDTAVSNIQL